MQIKKYLLFVLVLVVLLPKHCLAQANTKSTYLKRRDNYFRVYNQFLSDRYNYWQQETIESKEKFRKSTREFLLVRDYLLVSYFNLLLNKSAPVDSQYRIEISNWQGWVTEHQREIRQAYSLDDLITLSKEFDEIYPEIEKSVYTFLTSRVINKQQEIADEVKVLSRQVALKTSNDDWQLEVNSELRAMKDDWQGAREVLDKIRTFRPGTMTRSWDKISDNLADAQNNLKQAVEFLNEVIFSNE